MDTKRTLRKLRQGPELWMTRFAMKALPLLPRKVVVGLAHLMGTLAYGLSGHLRKVGMTNLDIAYGNELTTAEKKKILRGSFRLFALVALDVFWFAGSKDRIERYVDLGDVQEQFIDIAGPRIAVSAHLGNWELLGKSISAFGCPLSSVVAPLNNAGVDAIFNQVRMDTGQTAVPKEGAVRKLLKTLKGNGGIALLLDQNTKPHQGGIFVDYFGKPAPMSTAAAMLALRSKASLGFGACIPQPGGHYCIKLFKNIEYSDLEVLPKEQATRQLTERIATVIQEAIKAQPDCWLWQYKRWKYITPGQASSDFPFYAKEMLPEDYKLAEAEQKKQRDLV